MLLILYTVLHPIWFFHSFSFLSLADIVYFSFIFWVGVWPDLLGLFMPSPCLLGYFSIWAIQILVGNVHLLPPTSLFNRAWQKRNQWSWTNLLKEKSSGKHWFTHKQLYLLNNLFNLSIFMPWKLVVLSCLIKILIFLLEKLHCALLIWYFVILQVSCNS